MAGLLQEPLGSPPVTSDNVPKASAVQEGDGDQHARSEGVNLQYGRVGFELKVRKRQVKHPLPQYNAE